MSTIEFPIRRCFGYDVSKQLGYVINEKEAETVRYMFDLVIEGNTIEEICVKCSRKITVVHTISKILHNIVYNGSAIYITEDTVYYMPDHHEPIVSKAKWNAVQCVLLGRSQSHGYYPMRIIKEGPLKGFIPIEYMWFGRELDDYVEACKCIMSDVDYTFDIGTVQFPIWENEWRKKLFAAHNLSTISHIKSCHVPYPKNGIYISFQSKRIYAPCSFDCFEILIHPMEKILVLRSCEYGMERNNTNEYRCSYARWLIYELMGWDKSQAYVIPGQRLGGMLFFDLTGNMRLPESMVNGFSAQELNKYEPVCIEKDFWSKKGSVHTVHSVHTVAPEGAEGPCIWLKEDAPAWAKDTLMSLQRKSSSQGLPYAGGKLHLPYAGGNRPYAGGNRPYLEEELHLPYAEEDEEVAKIGDFCYRYPVVHRTIFNQGTVRNQGTVSN